MHDPKKKYVITKDYQYKNFSYQLKYKRILTVLPVSFYEETQVNIQLINHIFDKIYRETISQIYIC